MIIKCHMTPGHGRNFSQDRLLVYDTILAKGSFETEWPNELNGCLAIFDGVGGIQGGEYASGYAAAQMWNYPLQHGVAPLNAYLQGISASLRNYNGCATTATGIICVNGQYFLFHLGNTRMWKFDGKYLRQLTKDQTYIEDSEKPLSRSEMERNSSVITGCLGGSTAELSERIHIEDITAIIAGNSKLLFTCDGIHDYVDVFDIEQALKTDHVDLRSIVALARDCGSNDDCSIMLVDRKEG